MDIDCQFIESINKKKDKGWKELYRKFYPALCNYATRILKDPDVAEDVVQDCFIKIWDSGTRFPDAPSLTAYLYRMVYTRSLNLIRDKGYSQQLYQEWGDEAVAEQEEDKVIEIAVEEDVVTKFYTAISGLSDQQRQILLMSMEGGAVKQIAEKLNISENSVKTQKKRAYTYVREQLGKQWVLLIFLSLS